MTNRLMLISLALFSYLIATHPLEALDIAIAEQTYRCGEHAVVVERMAADESFEFSCKIYEGSDIAVASLNCSHQSNSREPFYGRGIVFDGRGELIAYDEKSCLPEADDDANP